MSFWSGTSSTAHSQIPQRLNVCSSIQKRKRNRLALSYTRLVFRVVGSVLGVARSTRPSLMGKEILSSMGLHFLCPRRTTRMLCATMRRVRMRSCVVRSPLKALSRQQWMDVLSVSLERGIDRMICCAVCISTLAYAAYALLHDVQSTRMLRQNTSIVQLLYTYLQPKLSDPQPFIRIEGYRENASVRSVTHPSIIPVPECTIAIPPYHDRWLKNQLDRLLPPFSCKF